jgi:glycosyltransferase involved in cell wall biosynthesis
VVTYNQEKYICQCLQSIVDQDAGFPFEVIVGDDCSTDGTQAIIKEFAARYPGVIKPVFHEKNVGNCHNLILVYQQAAGEYIAQMDGDDFMLPGKLKLQAEALDRNPDCAICVHAMKEFDQQSLRYRKFKPIKVPEKSDAAFLLMNLPFFPHSSKMFRTIYQNDLKLPAGEFLDCYLHIHHALKGKILYLKNVLGVYRFGVGLSTAKNNGNSDYAIFKTKMLKLAIEAIEYAGRLGLKEEVINKAKAKIYFEYAHYYLMQKDFNQFRLLLDNSIKSAKFSNSQILFKSFSEAPLFLFSLVRVREMLRGAK